MKNAKLSLLILLTGSVINTPALARPEYVPITGAKDCTVCHADNFGRAPWKPGVLDAFSMGGIQGLINFVKSGGTNDTAPVLSPISAEWNVTVGESPLKIPLHVFDKENDTFTLRGSTPMVGTVLSKLYIDTTTNLPTQDLLWTPTASDANKTYAIKVNAAENAAGHTLISNNVKANIYVWPARANAQTALVQDFKISTARWASGVLTLYGQVTFKSQVTDVQRTSALSTLTLNLTSNTGVSVGTPQKLKLNNKGNWSTTVPLPAKTVPCMIVGNYEGLNAKLTVGSAPTRCLQ